MKRLAIVLTHPIQYYVPIFQLLQQRALLQLKVFYTWEQAKDNLKYDPGFGKTISWDLPLLEGYDYTFVRNMAKDPGSHHFMGIQNPSLIQELEEWQADAILVFGWSFLSHLRLLRYFKGKVPVFFRGDSTLLDEEGQGLLKRALRRLFLRQVYRFVDKAFYVGQWNYEYYKAHGLADNQLIFAPHAIDNARFSLNHQKLEEVEKIRHSLEIPSDAYLTLFVGKFQDKKDPLLLLQAFRCLQPANTYLLFVGNGELEDRLRQKAASIPAVRFLPFQNQQQMPSVYAAADLLVLPSRGPGETWGLVVNEAMASGRAVLVSNKAGCSADLVQEGKNGYTFKAADIDALVQQLGSLVSSKERTVAMGQYSTEIIRNYSFEAVCRVIEKEIAELN